MRQRLLVVSDGTAVMTLYASGAAGAHNGWGSQLRRLPHNLAGHTCQGGNQGWHHTGMVLGFLTLGVDLEISQS